MKLFGYRILALACLVSIAAAPLMADEMYLFYDQGHNRSGHHGSRHYGNGYRDNGYWGFGYNHYDRRPFLSDRYIYANEGIHSAAYAACGWPFWPLLQFEVDYAPQRVVTALTPPPPPKPVVPLVLTGADFEKELLSKHAAVIKGIEFKGETEELRPTSGAALEKVAAFIKQNPAQTFSVLCYTDSNGAPGYLKDLSKVRASSVVQALVVYGVSSSSVTALGMGWAPEGGRNRSPLTYGNHVELRVNGQ